MTIEKQRPLLPTWYTDRFVRTPPKENPADQNIPVIRDAFAQLLLQPRSLVPNAEFSIEQPITLVTKTSDRIEQTLQYALERKTKNDRTYYKATVKIQERTTAKWLSRRMWFIEKIDDDYLGRYLDIKSDSYTRLGWQGNRFGISLMLMSDDVINHQLHHITQYNHLSAKATILDDAYGHFLTFKSREGWTSAIATRMGYTRTAPYEFEKWFR